MPDPNKIEGGRWDRVLRSKYNLKGSGPTSARISDDISPTYNFPFELEDQYLIGDRLMYGESGAGPVAALFPRLELTNASDNLLVIVEKIVFDSSGGGSPYFGANSGLVPFTNALNTFPRDGRWGALETNLGDGAVRLQGGELGAARIPRIVRFTDGVDTTFLPNLVMQPGDSCFMSNGTANTFLLGTFFWREHLMEQSERA